VAVTPEGCPTAMVYGRVQVFVGKMIPVGGHLAVVIRYRMANGQ